MSLGPDRAARRARPDDADAIADLERECLGADAWSPGLVLEAVGGGLPTVEVLVVEVDGVVAAYAAASIVVDVAELQRLAVTPRRRRAGLAGELVREVLRLAWRGGAARLLLEVREDNGGARAFYEAVGFVELGRRERYFRDGSAAVVLAASTTDGDPETNECTTV